MENQDIIDDQGGGLTESENQAAEKPAFSEDQQALIDGIIEKRLARQNQKHQAELEAERLKREELEKKMNPGDENLELPEKPDILDPDFEMKQAQYNEALIKKERAIARKEERAKIKEENDQNNAQAKARQLAETYSSNAKVCGIDQAQLDQYTGVILDAGITQDVAVFVMDEKKGPLVTQHLAENQNVLDELVSITSLPKRQRFLINLESKLKPKEKATPPPDETTPPAETGTGTTRDWVMEATKGASFD